MNPLIRNCVRRCSLVGVVMWGLLGGAVSAQGLFEGNDGEVEVVLERREVVGGLDEVVLQLHKPMDAIYAGYVMAIEQGYYAQEGLAVSLRDLGRGERAISEVQAGRADYFTSASGMLLRKMRGLPLVMVGVTLPRSSLRLVLRKDISIEKPEDIEGLRFGILLDTVDIESREFFRQSKVDESTLKFVYHMGPEEGYRAMVRGEIDGYLTPYPYKLEELDGNENLLTVIKPRKYGVDFIGGCFATITRELENNPSRVERFRRATMRGWYYAATHRDATIELMEAKYGLEKGDVDFIITRFRTDVVHRVETVDGGWMGDIPIERWEGIANAMVGLGLIESWEPEDLESFIYSPSPLEMPREAWWMAGVLMGALAMGLGHVGWRWLLHKRVVARTSVLMDSEAQYRELYTRNVQPILVLDVESRMAVEFNAAALEMLGYSSGELLRLSLSDLEVTNGGAKRLDALFEAGHGRYETRLRVKNGEVLDVLMRIETIELGGEAAYELVLEDRTRQKTALIELEAKAQWGRLLAEGAGGAAMLVDDSGVIVECSRALCGRLGFDRGALVGMAASEVDMTWNNSDRHSMLDRFEGGQTVMGSSVFRCRDGSEFETSVRVAAVEEGGEAYRVVMIGVSSVS